MSIIEKERDGSIATFIEYRNGEYWYRTDAGFDYPAPAFYAGEAAQLALANSMTFLR